MIKSIEKYATNRDSATLADFQDRFAALLEQIQSEVNTLHAFDPEVREELIEYALSRGRFPLCFLDCAERMSVRLQLYRQLSRRLMRTCTELGLIRKQIALAQEAQ